MYCLSVDPGKNNIAILVVDVDKANRTVEIVYNIVVDIESKDIYQFHLLLIREIRFLYELYKIELTTIESQQKGTNGSIYLHNLYNTNVQGIVFTIALMQNCPTAIVKPSVWHVLLNGKKKGLKMYRSLLYPFEIKERYLLRSVHEYDALTLLISQLIQ